MNFRKISLLAVSIAALAPAISQATVEKTALNSCAQAFVTSLAANGAPAPTYRVAYNATESAGSMVEFYKREFAFELSARNPKTGSKFARASCATDARGNVVSLSSMPLEAGSPALASPF